MKLEECKPGVAIEFNTISRRIFGIIKEYPKPMYIRIPFPNPNKVLCGYSAIVITDDGKEALFSISSINKYTRRPKNGTI